VSEQKKKIDKSSDDTTAEIDDNPGPVETNVDEHVIDDLLDEIDDVLEENAEEFVRGYVQKGGE
jgi:ubiquitin-like protein Pup